MDYTQILNIAKEAAREAGKIILHSKAEIIHEKSRSDYVTEVDIKCQDRIKEIISKEYPAHNFLAEEDGQNFEPVNDLWIIDPLDGTTNFIHGLKHSAVSIAYYNRNDVQVGVIYQPYTDELFHAVKGKGSFMNNSPITVSKEKNISRSIIATGMPFRKPEKIKVYFECLAEVLSNCSGIRRMGSAAIDLAYTACGRFEGFYEGWLSPWDIAAGKVILEEAGGIFTDFNGGKKYFDHGCIVIGNEQIHRDLLTIIKTKLGEQQ
ncbi:MAG: inositol monophosphatase [Candidatus Delongbacteria bacterium]|nr:inositol monophosphatase [Candidatus Delongbacteria bacterium]